MEPQSGLSDRQLEIIQYIIKGKTAKEIASILNVSLFSIESHLKNIREKPNLKNSSEIADFYYQLERNFKTDK